MTKKTLFAVPLLLVLVLAAFADQATVRLSKDSPTGKAKPVLTLAKFDIGAQDTDLKIDMLAFRLTQTGSPRSWSSADTVSRDIVSIALYDETGAKLTSLTPNGTGEYTGATYTDSFGTAKPLSMIIPKGTAKTIALGVEVRPGTSITTLKGSLVPPMRPNAGGKFVPGRAIHGKIISL